MPDTNFDDLDERESEAHWKRKDYLERIQRDQRANKIRLRARCVRITNIRFTLFAVTARQALGERKHSDTPSDDANLMTARHGER